jgi:hypothetical protein
MRADALKMTNFGLRWNEVSDRQVMDVAYVLQMVVGGLKTWSLCLQLPIRAFQA